MTFTEKDFQLLKKAYLKSDEEVSAILERLTIWTQHDLQSCEVLVDPDEYNHVQRQADTGDIIQVTSSNAFNGAKLTGRCYRVSHRSDMNGWLEHECAFCTGTDVFNHNNPIDYYIQDSEYVVLEKKNGGDAQ